MGAGLLLWTMMNASNERHKSNYVPEPPKPKVCEKHNLEYNDSFDWCCPKCREEINAQREELHKQAEEYRKLMRKEWWSSWKGTAVELLLVAAADFTIIWFF